MAIPGPSPFFDSTPTTKPGDLAILHLRRDHSVPIILSNTPTEDYPDGAVTNTRFGSFPHKTLLGQKWGAQVLAYKIDTGGRASKSLKRKRAADAIATPAGDLDVPNGHTTAQKDDASEPMTAQTGFAHLMPPTPEAWTVSLPHRTQVVYTPDSSYILQRMRVRPGQTVIEAGAGSGSFTHAAARAVFNGHPNTSGGTPKDRYGQVCSFEYHATRAAGLRTELKNHRLDDIVRVTHRDVYAEGFWLPNTPTTIAVDSITETASAPPVETDTTTTKLSPLANAIFLDLPAPWQALPHLVRNPSPDQGPSPLDPSGPVHICTFSPCIEQVTSTVEVMRSLGYAEIEMVEILHKRLDIRREPAGNSVHDALARLRDLEARASEKEQREREQGKDADADEDVETKPKMNAKSVTTSDQIDKTSAAPTATAAAAAAHVVRHRTEPDLKGHSSYLVFAVIPQVWTDADEAACVRTWGSGPALAAEELSRNGNDRGAKKEARRKAHEAKMGKKKKKTGNGSNGNGNMNTKGNINDNSNSNSSSGPDRAPGACS